MDTRPKLTQMHARLSKIGFTEWASISEADVLLGDPHTYCRFFRFIFTHFPQATVKLLEKYVWFVIDQEDSSLAATTIRLLSVEFHVAAAIRAAQFSTPKFANAKMTMVLNLLDGLQRLTARQQPVSSPRRVSDAPTQHLAINARQEVRNGSSSSLLLQSVLTERRRQLNSCNRI